MAAGRFNYGTATYVEAPAFAPAQGGLLDVSDVRTVASGDPALRGFMYESELPEVALGVVTGYVQSSTAAMNEGLAHNYETSFDPFTIYGSFGVDSGAGETVEDAKTRAQRRLALGEGLAAERGFWETGGILPTQASVVRSGAMKAKLAVGLLAEWWSQSNNGVPYFHAGRRIVNEIASQQLVEFDANEAMVKGGTALINGAGYFAKTTIGGVTPTADQAWLYISGKPLIYRGGVQTTGAHGAQSAVATANNRIVAFASRTYVPSIDGPTGVVLVDLTL